MSRVNTASHSPKVCTHEGGKAVYLTDQEKQLRRSVMACMLWENSFYEDGQSIADRIADTIPLVNADIVRDIAIEARNKMHLRHVPLMLAKVLARSGYHGTAELIDSIIQRPDELTEFLALYWSDGRKPLTAQVKKGLAKAFLKFDAYALAKYNRPDAIKLRDVMFLTHPKPNDEAQADIWKQLAEGTLASPDTWEVALSSGADKKATWERLIAEKKLGGLALIRNLRNMESAGVPEQTIRNAIIDMRTDRILPYRFIAAAKYAPRFEPELESAMFRCLVDHVKLHGKTVLLVDVSGSMDGNMSNKSDIKRIDAACGLAMLLREICDSICVCTFSYKCVIVPPRRGFALRDAILNSQEHGGTCLSAAVDAINKHEAYDRIIVITDEQSHDGISDPTADGYVINVAAYENGVGYRRWLHIDGFSDAVVDYIITYEGGHD